MRIIDNLDEMVETARGWLADGTVSLVSVSSNLHNGHQALLRAAHNLGKISVVCIINKTSLFGVQSTTSRYAGDLTRDLRLLSSHNIDIVFIPRAEELYPSPTFSTYITPTGPLTNYLESISSTSTVRKFATTMTKLFQIVRPDIALFGQKDALFNGIVHQLVRDLNLDITLYVLPTVRELDGLAISSRNQQLSATERKAAPVLYQALCKAKILIEAGERETHAIELAICTHIAQETLISPAYVSLCHAETFYPLSQIAPGILIAVGANVGKVQLIDNIVWTSNGTWSIE